MLGAFAVDDPLATYGLALLPQEPLTLFPVEDPVFSTDGRDGLCGSRADCQEAMDQVVARAHATDLRSATVGIGRGDGDADTEFMSQLELETGGGAYWVDEPAGLSALLAHVRGELTAGLPTIQASFRIRSPVAGAFAPGRVVMGWVELGYCPWECETVRVPFRARIDQAVAGLGGAGRWTSLPSSRSPPGLACLSNPSLV